MQSKKLFAIRDTQSNKTIPDLFFNDKILAKKHRSTINPKNDDGNEVMLYVVTYGPDHRKYSK